MTQKCISLSYFISVSLYVNIPFTFYTCAEPALCYRLGFNLFYIFENLFLVSEVPQVSHDLPPVREESSDALVIPIQKKVPKVFFNSELCVFVYI